MAQPIEAFRNSFKIPELKSRIIFTITVLLIYRLGAHVPTPGVNGQALADVVKEFNFLVFYDMFTGGAFAQATIFALGIMPYISASIIMSLLVVVVPQLEQLQKQGAEGQKKITEITRYGTLALCVVQSIGFAVALTRLNSPENPILMSEGIGFYLMCILSFTAGSIFIMWLGEQISEHGVGNGMSLLIFVSIIASMPTAVARLFGLVSSGELSMFNFLSLIFIFVVVVAAVILITTGQRRIPIQYPRQARGGMTTTQRNYLPLRVNQAGVIPIIFASSLLMFPGMIAQNVNVPLIQDFGSLFQMGGPLYNVVYSVLIVFFSFFYTAIIFNPIEMADNLKKYGGVVTGIRPGKATAEYLNKVMTRITLVGSIFLVGIALLPSIMYSWMGLYDFTIAQFFGGTSLLILVGVGLDTVKQMEQHLIMRSYEGFSKGRRLRSRRGR